MTNEEAYSELDRLAPQVRAAAKEAEQAYYAWTAACEKLKRLDREHTNAWRALFDNVANPSEARSR
jgi:DNA repair ATPase RecN